jgi:hypothetical protein
MGPASHNRIVALIENSVTLVRALRRTADETLGPLEEQLEQRQHTCRGQQHRRGEQHYQNAAELAVAIIARLGFWKWNAGGVSRSGGRAILDGPHKCTH